ncbi:restriction endonuclease subunit S [Nocardia nova]|uniref:restriction endonuclease subunit S n=1 Tax=Nocardia nova TaxID=37330 RepID=UPI000CE9C894|nr:restriction endonuclease subunit S [Nocardia nova]PPJ24422.1 restriction endonuclease subunit S [Nocardia nova]
MNSSYPESWEVVSLDSICRPKQWATINVGELTEDGFPVYGANGKIGYYSSYNHTQPTVLITCRGASCGAINISEPNSYVTGNAMALDDMNTSRVDLNYLARTLARRGYLRKAITGSAQPQITRETLRSVSVPLPPLAEQRRIAEVLDRVDALREKRRKSIALLDELAQSIFLDMFGNLREAEASYGVTSIGEVALQVTDGEHQTPKRQLSGIKLLSARNIRDGYLDIGNVDYIGEEEYVRISKRCDPQIGDVLISCSGSIGRVATFDLQEPIALVRSVALVRPDPSIVAPTYLSALLRTPELQNKMQQSAKSSSQANLFQGPIRKLPVPVPPMEEQKLFEQRIRGVELATVRNQEHLNQLDTLFASIQSRAFRGELWQDELKDM